MHVTIFHWFRTEIYHGRVAWQAIRAALQKFENGGNIEDAKAVCGPDILNQMVIWKVLRYFINLFFWC